MQLCNVDDTIKHPGALKVHRLPSRRHAPDQRIRMPGANNVFSQRRTAARVVGVPYLGEPRATRGDADEVPLHRAVFTPWQQQSLWVTGFGFAIPRGAWVRTRGGTAVATL